MYKMYPLGTGDSLLPSTLFVLAVALHSLCPALSSVAVRPLLRVCVLNCATRAQFKNYCLPPAASLNCATHAQI